MPKTNRFIFSCAFAITSGMKSPTAHDPLHGITLEKLLTILMEHYGWENLHKHVNINCFKSNPSIKSSLTFLRRTPWARAKVEDLYFMYLREMKK